MATVDNDGSAYLWNIHDPRHPGAPAPLIDHDKVVNAVAFSPDGTTLATADADGAAKLWDVATRQPVGTFTGHIGALRSVAFHLDGHTVATAGDDHIVRLWETDGSILSSPAIVSDVQDMTFSPDGNILALAGGTGTSQLWDVARRSPIKIPSGQKGSGNAGVFSGNGRLLAIPEKDGSVQLWDTVRQGLIVTLPGPAGSRDKVGETLPVSSNYKTFFSPDDQTLAVIDADNIVYLWNATNSSSPKFLGPFLSGCPSNAVAFSGDGRLLAAVCTDGTVRLVDIARRSQIAQLITPEALIVKVAFSPDGGSLIAVNTDPTVLRWKTTNGTLIDKFHLSLPGEPNLKPLALSSGGHTLATSTDDNTTVLWNVDRRGEVIATLDGHTSQVNAAAFSQDDRLATASKDGTVRLWDLNAGRLVDRLSRIIGISSIVNE